MLSQSVQPEQSSSAKAALCLECLSTSSETVSTVWFSHYQENQPCAGMRHDLKLYQIMTHAYQVDFHQSFTIGGFQVTRTISLSISISLAFLSFFVLSLDWSKPVYICVTCDLLQTSGLLLNQLRHNKSLVINHGVAGWKSDRQRKGMRKRPASSSSSDSRGVGMYYIRKDG